MESRELSRVEETASAKALRQCAQETARKPAPPEQSEGGGRAGGVRSAGPHRALSPGRTVGACWSEMGAISREGLCRRV